MAIEGQTEKIVGKAQEELGKSKIRQVGKIVIKNQRSPNAHSPSSNATGTCRWRYRRTVMRMNSIRDGAAIDFVRNAFGHLKAIAVDKGCQALLIRANIENDAGVVDTSDKDALIEVAKTRQWDREKSVRTLA